MPKGVYKRTDEHKKNIGKALKGSKQTENHKVKRGLYLRKDKSANWKGGSKRTGGYIFLYSPNHPFSVKRYVKRSRLVMEKHLGRYLTSKEVVHHISRDKQDDRIENLQLFATQSTHRIFHNKLCK